MSAKRLLTLTVLALVALVLIGTIMTVLLVQSRPSWYEPATLSREELLEAEEQMIRTAAEFQSAAQVAESFILELSGKQINDRLAVLADRRHILPDDITDPVVFLGDGVVYIGARVTWKGQQAIVSTRLTGHVDSDGLLRLELGKLKAGTLALPENFLADSLAKLQQTLTAKLATSRSNSDEARTAKKNKDLLVKIFASLNGVPVEPRFVTREDLQVTIEEIRIRPNKLEIKFRPLPTDPLSD